MNHCPHEGLIYLTGRNSICARCLAELKGAGLLRRASAGETFEFLSHFNVCGGADKRG
jgi:hypothetical protein